MALLVSLVAVGCSGDDDDTTTGDGTPAGDTTAGDTTVGDEGGGVAPVERIVFDSNRGGNYEIYAMADDGTDVVQLTRDDAYDAFWARPSPDGTRVLFYRVPAGRHNMPGEYRETTLWVMEPDGTRATEIVERGAFGWEQQGHAEWSPDGAALTMFAGSQLNPQIWVTDADGRDPRQVTRDPGTNVDPAWSPDGSKIAYVACPEAVCLPTDQEVYTVPAAGGKRTRLTADSLRDHDPYYSPDGREIAFLTQTAAPGGGRSAGSWNLRIVGVDGGAVRMLTDDSDVNSRPAWSPDGTTIFFHRLDYDANEGFQIWALDVASGRRTQLTSSRDGTNEFPGV